VPQLFAAVASKNFRCVLLTCDHPAQIATALEEFVVVFYEEKTISRARKFSPKKISPGPGKIFG
jgi:hypothetical protein